MCKIAAILCLLASPLAAQERFAFGTGCAAEMVLTDDGAEVTITNAMIPLGAPDRGTLDIGGFVVGIEAEHRRGTEPDIFTVYAPPGYVAVPWRVVLPENATAVVQIIPVLGS